MNDPKALPEEKGESIEYWGSGWFYYPSKDWFVVNAKMPNEFVVTGDILRMKMTNWGRKVERVHVISILKEIKREHDGI